MLRNLKENYEREKAKLKGEARSEARMIKNAVDIPGVAEHLASANGGTLQGAPTGIAGAFVRMKDGAAMQFHTDGSIRHAFGKDLNKAAKKRMKKQRRAAWKQQ